MLANTKAIAFDIDGVFKAGRHFFPDGLHALTTARKAGAAVCFVTNGMICSHRKDCVLACGDHPVYGILVAHVVLPSRCQK